jgi:hypothetical protein
VSRCVSETFFSKKKILLLRFLHSTKEDGLLFLLAPRGSEIRESCRAQLPIVLLLQSCHGLVRVRRSRGSVHDSHVRLPIELLPFFFQLAGKFENQHSPNSHSFLLSLSLSFIRTETAGFTKK